MANPRESRPVLHTKKHTARLERERQQTRWIFISFIAILVAVVGLIAYGLAYPKYIQPNLTIAKVEGVSIKAGPWQVRVKFAREQLISQYQTYQQYQAYGLDVSSQLNSIAVQLSDATGLGQKVLDQMIDEEVIRQEAAKRGITVSRQEVDNAIQAAFDYFPSGTPTPTITPTAVTVVYPTLSAETLKLVTITPTPTEFLTPTAAPTSTPDVLTSPTATVPPTATATVGPTDTITPTASITPTATPYTLDLYKQRYKDTLDSLTKIGFGEQEAQQLYESNLLRDKLFEVITADVSNTQDEILVRHILVADEATAKQVEDRLAKGEDFGTVAKEVSTDTGSAENGGDLGWNPHSAFVKEFTDAAFSLKVGEFSQPVKSQFGYHIIQVLAHADIPLTDTQYQQAKQVAFDDWLKQARDEYKVQTFDNWKSMVPTDPAAPAVSQ
ncbi:MAG TPA: peptidylprolyl isomerase [Anaerolineales bacterium]|nr:peptidylprolyl isomerase [Anaerolineales bacterium]